MSYIMMFLLGFLSMASSNIGMNLCCACILILIHNWSKRVYKLQKNSNPSKGIFVGEVVGKAKYICISLAQLHRERQLVVQFAFQT